MNLLPSGTKEKGRAPEGCGQEKINMFNIASITGETTLIPKPGKANGATPHILYGGVEEMTPSEWAKVTDNPRQRDTEARARRAAHLRSLHPSHCKVDMAVLPDGRRIKLNGHTRSYLWVTGAVEPPPMLYVDIWSCRSIEDVKNLYTTFDSKSAVETATDQVFGAVREKGLSFHSDVLANNRFAASVRHAYEILFGQVPARAISMYDLVSYWGPELRLLDSCNPTRRRFHSGVIAGALITFRRFGTHALPFWEAYSSGGGWKADGEMDAVQAYEDRILRRGAEGRISGRGNIHDIVRITLSAFDRYRSGETYSISSSGIKTLSVDAAKKWVALAKSNGRAK